MLHFLVTLQTLVADRSERFHDDENGATAVEYGLMVALIAAVIIGVVGLLGGEVAAKFQQVCTSLNSGVACT